MTCLVHRKAALNCRPFALDCELSEPLAFDCNGGVQILAEGGHSIAGGFPCSIDFVQFNLSRGDFHKGDMGSLKRDTFQIKNMVDSPSSALSSVLFNVACCQG